MQISAKFGKNHVNFTFYYGYMMTNSIVTYVRIPCTPYNYLQSIDSGMLKPTYHVKMTNKNLESYHFRKKKTTTKDERNIFLIQWKIINYNNRKGNPTTIKNQP